MRQPLEVKLFQRKIFKIACQLSSFASLTGCFLETHAPAEVSFPVVADFVGPSGAGNFAVEVLVTGDALIEADAVFQPGIATGGGTADGSAAIGCGHAGIAAKLMEAG